MVKNKDKKSKSGWVISIQDLGLNTTFSTKESSKPKAKETLTKIQFRIDQLKQNKDDEFFVLDWQLNVIKYLGLAEWLADVIEVKRGHDGSFCILKFVRGRLLAPAVRLRKKL